MKPYQNQPMRRRWHKSQVLSWSLHTPQPSMSPRGRRAPPAGDPRCRHPAEPSTGHAGARPPQEPPRRCQARPGRHPGPARPRLPGAGGAPAPPCTAPRVTGPGRAARSRLRNAASQRAQRSGRRDGDAGGRLCHGYARR